MTDWLGALFLVAGFLAIVRRAGLVAKSRDVIAVAGRSASIVGDRRLDDGAKERELQGAARRLFGLFVSLLFGGAAACLLPFGLLWPFDQMGWISLGSVLHVTISPTFLLLSTSLALAAWITRGRKPPESQSHPYSAVDRVLHRLAFATYGAQAALADCEDRVYARRLSACKVDRPVFIASLPRAGTTLLLERCAELPEFASHCYRDMPFVLIPCFWSRFSTAFRREGERRERAHGDGVLIDFDSHEALEEVVWKTFWRGHYRKDRIRPWRPAECGDDEFRAFLKGHLRKIIYLRCGDGAAAGRYVSKNNLNIARLPALHRLFPHATAITPFRRPLDHAASLLEQHRRFSAMHRSDPFARTYMRAIGHFDFGDNLRPVDFNGWLDRRESDDPTALTFWLQYWIETFDYLLDTAGEADHFVSYEALCDDPQRGLGKIAEAIGCRDADALRSGAGSVRAVRAREVDAAAVPRDLLRAADRVYRRLQDAALWGRRHA